MNNISELYIVSSNLLPGRNTPIVAVEATILTFPDPLSGVAPER